MSWDVNSDENEWQWRLAINLSKNKGIPSEQEYWENLEEKIMSEISLIDQKPAPIPRKLGIVKGFNAV